MKSSDTGVSVILGFLFVFCLIVLSSIPDSISINKLGGEWKGFFKSSVIVLKIDSDSKCTLYVNNQLKDNINQFTGTCSIEGSKRPYSFSITNIDETLYPLHSLLLRVDDHTIHVAEFSSKWRLRPLSLHGDNTIILKKTTN